MKSTALENKSTIPCWCNECVTQHYIGPIRGQNQTISSMIMVKEWSFIFIWYSERLLQDGGIFPKEATAPCGVSHIPIQEAAIANMHHYQPSST